MILAAGAGRYAGPLGLLVVLLMGVALVVLVRGMNKRLRRLPSAFEEPVDETRREDPPGAG